MKTNRILLLIIVSLLTVLSANAQSLSYAKRLIDKGEYRLAAEQLRPLAENGDAEACYLAAQLFVDGKGVMKSHKQAEKYFLKAVEKDNEQAAVELVALYESMNQKEKAVPIMEEFYKKSYEKVCKTILGYTYGLYIYHGYGGLKKDLSRGWSIMCSSEQNPDELEKMKDEFYSVYIKTMIVNPDSFWHHLFDVFWSVTQPDINMNKWTANYLDDAVMAVKTLPFETQTTHLKECEKIYENGKRNNAITLVLAMMYAEGVGMEKDYAKAKDIYSSNINDKGFMFFIDNLFKNWENGFDGHLKSSDFPEFWKVIMADTGEREKRFEYEKKKKLIQTNCTATCFKVKGIKAWRNEKDGNLHVRFDVYNTSPNPSGRVTTAYGAFIKYNNKYHNVKLNYYIPDIQTIGIKGHATTPFTVIIPANLLTNENEIELVNFRLKSDWGEGIINAKNVVWLE